MPHALTARHLINRIEICDTLLKHNEMEPFLKRLIRSDAKWIKYENVKRKRSWSKRSEVTQTTGKPGLTANKVMLSVWWDWKGIVYYEILEPGQTVDSVLYCQQLIRL